LEQVAQSISTGDFEVTLPHQSQDEVGSLAAAMQTMASKIKDLLGETIQKTRMESELKVAKAVQENLLPESHFQSQKLSGAGYYQPASECGGDLWYTFESGSSRFIAILDATGHGAGPALVTSAVRAAFTLLENEPEIKLTAIAEKLNRVIDSVSKGQILMTAFLVRLDLHTGRGEYVNCSHEQPILLRGNNEDLDYLSDPVNPRLGQDLNSRFEAGTFDLKAGDRLIFYTDGVTDLKNPAGKNFGDRRFLKIIQDLHHQGLSTEEFNQTLVQNLDDFSESTELPDDMTFINVLSQ
jgi:sigma-B regulation protein RsbU (phosphoserine phosphatase)